MAGRVVLHVGLAKTGTTYLQRLLADGSDRLLEAGVLVASVGPGSAFRGAVDVRGSREKFGLGAAQVDGVWQALCAIARDHAAAGGTVLLGHEVLAGATRAQVAAALRPLAGIEVDVVVTARDLGRQATAHWQEEVKLGDTRSFARFEAEELRADTGPDDGPDAGGVRPRFWHAQDLADALARWTGRGAAGHLVVGPAPGATPGVLWQRYAAAAGLDPALLDVTGTEVANPSLGRAQIALLRRVNAELDGRLDVATRLRVVKRGYAEGVLAAEPAGPTSRAATPAELAPLLTAATERWLGQVADAGWTVHGPVADLTPVVAPPGAPPPDGEPPPGVDPRRVARDLLAQAQAQADTGAPARRRWTQLSRRARAQ